MHKFVIAAGFVGLAGAALAQGGGTTSGPAAGSPATLGTGGQVPATAHQADTVRNGGGVAIGNERQGQASGTTDSVKPGAAAAESGAAPRK